MAFKDVIDPNPKRAYMLTNEAIVRSALEADVKVVSFYPGAPQTEILDTFDRAFGNFDYRMEIAANEKVALETAAGAAFVGMRSMTSMKSVGTNVASDTLYSLAYTGVRGGMLCCIADDPYCHSSQSEQDGRWFGYTSYLPMLEPSGPSEAMHMVKEAFRLSEKYGSVVLMRTTTRVNHQSGIVRTGPIDRTPFEKLPWGEGHPRYATVGAAARDLKLKLMDRISRMKDDPDLLALNRVEYFDGSTLVPRNGGAMGKKAAGSEGKSSAGEGKVDKGSAGEGKADKDSAGEGKAGKDCSLGVVANGAAYLYAVESLRKLGIPAHVLKIGVLNPLPEDMIASFLEPLDRVVVVEELFPYMETFVTALAAKANPGITIYGKRSGHFQESMEYNIPIVLRVLAEAAGREPAFDHLAHADRIGKAAEILPLRLPVFCAGCPHRATFWSLFKALGDRNRVFFANDIGCYSMACLEPMAWSDSMLAMGASVGVAAGVQYATDAKVVAMIGDSTLFHAGLPGIVNAVHNDDDITLFIMDNSVTAMTGQQTHPAHPEKAGGREGTRLDIEAMLRGLGVEKIVTIDSYEVMQNIKLIREALDHKGPSVVISRRECALYHFRNYRHAGGRIVPFFIDPDTCRNAYTCIRDFMCPAISVDPETGHSRIAPDICVGCGVCARICGFKAIQSTATLRGGENRPYIEVEDYLELERTLREGGGTQTRGKRTGDDKTGGTQTRGKRTGDDRTGGKQTEGKQKGDDKTGGTQTRGTRTGDDKTGGTQTRGKRTGDDKTGGKQTRGTRTGNDRTGGKQTRGTRTGRNATGEDTTEVDQ